MVASKKRIFSIAGISIIGFVALLFILPELFPGFVSRKIKGFVNESIEGKLDFRKARLSLLNHFPALTLSLYDFKLTGSEPYAHDTLIAGKELAFGVNLFTIFREKLSINQFFLDEAFINIQVDSLGNANYNVVKSSGDTTVAVSDTSGGAALRIEKIRITNSRLVYNDRSLPMILKAEHLNYKGNGDLTKEIVDLASNLRAKEVSFEYDGETYAIDKAIEADLVTRINTGDLEFTFTRNDLRVNQLPVDFTGFIRFPESGYDIDLRFKSTHADLTQVISVLPPAYLQWMAETELKGQADLFLNFIGGYRAETETYPTLSAGMDIRQGFIKHRQAPVSVSDFGLGLRFELPALDADKMTIDVDTLHMLLGKGFLRGNLHQQGMNLANLHCILQANANLGDLTNATGIRLVQLKGTLLADLVMRGAAQPGRGNPSVMLPYVNASLLWKDGYLKTEFYPDPIEDIQVEIVAQNKTGTFGDMQFDIKPIRFLFSGQPFMVKADLKDFDNIRYDVESHGTLDIGRIAKVFVPEEYGVEVMGLIKTDLYLKGSLADAEKGRLDRLDNRGTLELQDISLKSKELPELILIETGQFRAHQDKLVAENLKLVYGRNVFKLQGYYQNLFPFMMGTGLLKGGLSLQSDTLFINDFLADTGQPADTVPTSTSNQSTGVAMLPSNLDLELEANIRELVYKPFNLHDLRGKIQIKEGALFLKDAGIKMAGASTVLNASYKPQSTSSAFFDFDIRADSFDIQRFYKEVPLFAEMAPAAAKAKGQVSMKYTLEGRLNENMAPVLPSLKGGGSLYLHNVQVNNLKLFSAVAKTSGKDSINNPNLKQVELRTTIANNIMTLERTRMRILGFRPRMEGQASLDGKLNLRFRLGLPPFGLIGIPMTITGTMENPIVKMRKGNDEDELNETEDDEPDN